MITQKLVTELAAEYLTGYEAAMLLATVQLRNCCVYRVNFMVKPNGLLVTVSSTHYCAYTSVLSTW